VNLPLDCKHAHVSGHLSGAGPADMHVRSLCECAALAATHFLGFPHFCRNGAATERFPATYASTVIFLRSVVGVRRSQQRRCRYVRWDMMTCGVISVVPTAPVQAAGCFLSGE
ncbi:MAG TPA: hypothetical protein VEL76_32015, partial [Gemmataceae bacterium]|nr:hypothetical protein [Gemmataceae bacterium]